MRWGVSDREPQLAELAGVVLEAFATRYSLHMALRNRDQHRLDLFPGRLKGAGIGHAKDAVSQKRADQELPEPTKSKVYARPPNCSLCPGNPVAYGRSV